MKNTTQKYLQGRSSTIFTVMQNLRHLDLEGVEGKSVGRRSEGLSAAVPACSPCVLLACTSGFVSASRGT